MALTFRAPRVLLVSNRSETSRVCFIHYGGPLKNELMRTTIARWRQGG